MQCYALLKGGGNLLLLLIGLFCLNVLFSKLLPAAFTARI